MPKYSKNTALLFVAILAVGAVLACLRPNDLGETQTLGAEGDLSSALTLDDIPFDGQQSYEYLQAICRLGSRVAGTPGMQKQQQLLSEHFTQLGAEVQLQHFRVRHPLDGKPVAMANLIVEWRPEAKQRILLCAHYDTRPLPDRDPNPVKRRSGVFLGANDGGSGVAVLMELGRHMADYRGSLGVDFCFFDGEELVYDGNRDRYFLGSEWFSRQYVASPPPYRYRQGVLLDMVGDARLGIYQERNSVSWPETRPTVASIWRTAQRLGVKEFIPRVKHEIRDDHLPLRNLAKIPTCDVIDFDYPDEQNRYWHTTQDIPENCSALSLAKVGWVLWEWLKAETR
ncbi:MAG: M28 family peptidase [Planctomycetales bacterium]|nr:M28 family peptidase [Planctomycetales bacterium]